MKVLALAPGQRLHREQVIDLVWPQDTIAEAVPKLHKAAHFARRAIGVPDAVVLRGDQVILGPGGSVTVDAVQFEELARRALAAGDTAAAREALALYGGELLPGDRYEQWAEPRRDQLQRCHLDLLRLDGRWEAVAELDPGDERAHLALMRQFAASGDRHGALRQFERLDRALRQELGVAPGPEASALRDRLLADPGVFPRRDDPLIGRDLELSVADVALLDAAAGRSRTLVVVGEAGSGKSSLLTAVSAGAAELGMAAGHGTAAPVEGAWPYAPVIEALCGVCRQDPALLARLAGLHREEIERARNGTPVSWAGQSAHQPLFLAAAELVSLAAAERGLLLTVDDVHDADDGSLRLLHYLARSARGQRVCIVLAHRPVPAASALEATRRSLIDRYGAAELRLGPLGDRDAAALIRRYVAEPPAELVELVTTLGRGVPFLVTELARRAVLTPAAGPGSAAGPDWGQALQASMFARLRPTTREVLQRVAVAGASFDTDEFSALSGVPEQEAFGHLDDALAARIVEPAERGLPVPSLPHQGRAHRRRPGAPAPPGPPRHRPAPGRAGRLARAHRPPFPGGRSGRGRRAAPAVGGRDGIGRRRLPRRPGAGGRDPAARRRSVPDQGALAARRPAHRDRRPDGRAGLPGSPRRGRPGGCATAARPAGEQRRHGGRPRHGGGRPRRPRPRRRRRRCRHSPGAGQVRALHRRLRRRPGRGRAGAAADPRGGA